MSLCLHWYCEHTQLVQTKHTHTHIYTLIYIHSRLYTLTFTHMNTFIHIRIVHYMMVVLHSQILIQYMYIQHTALATSKARYIMTSFCFFFINHLFLSLSCLVLCSSVMFFCYIVISFLRNCQRFKSDIGSQQARHWQGNQVHLLAPLPLPLLHTHTHTPTWLLPLFIHYCTCM